MITRKALLRDPAAALQRVLERMTDCTGTVVTHDSSIVTIEITMPPPLEFEPHAYPTEVVRITQLESHEHPIAVPVTLPNRVWLHRNGHPWRDLCLWYPRDPEALRWTWNKGFEEYVEIVRRHLVFEEYHRRTGLWPTADAPHGERADGQPHPLNHGTTYAHPS